MKIPSKIAIVALSLNLLLPTASLAQGGDDSSSGSSHVEASSSPEVHSTEASRSPRPSESPKGKGEDAAKFCTNVGTFRTNISDDTDKKVEKLKTDFSEHKGEITTKRAELAKSLAEKRVKADAERTQRFKALESKAKTDAQISAVKAYEASVLVAVAKHRAAIDAADKTFIDGVAVAVGTRQTDLSAAAAAYKASMVAAFAQAKTSCAAGASPKSVRETFGASLRAAQAKFVEARKAAEKVRPNLDPLKVAHRAAIKTANTEFRASLKEAFTTLKAVLDISTSPSPNPSSSPLSN
jgi:hypothetical protein